MPVQARTGAGGEIDLPPTDKSVGRTAIVADPQGVALGRVCRRKDSDMDDKMMTVLWYDGEAEQAARFYAETFPDSSVCSIMRAPSDFPGGMKGDPLTVDFTVLGRRFQGLNGGPDFKPNESVSFMVITEDQAETDRYWNAIVGNGGEESACGWCKDRWGFSWQITPRTLLDALSAGGDEARRAFEAMMPMRKIDVGTIDAARKGA